MALQYLLDPQLQYSDKSGALNVAGFLRVYLNGTDDRATTYKDFAGTLNTDDIVLDSNGRAVVIADTSKTYRLEVYTSDGDLQWTQYPLNTIVGGSGGANGFVVESTDGSIAVDRYDSGGVIHYDLSSNVEDSTELLEWIRCDGATKTSDTYTPIYTDGTMEVGTKGIKVYADRYYHVTAHLRASKSTVQPYYDKVDVLFRLVDGNNIETNVIRQSVIVDSSVGLVQDFEVSTDVMVDEDSELLLDILNTTVPGITWEVLNLEAHRVFSGAPVIPGGVQRTLIAGSNITIEHTAAGDVISSTGGGGGAEYTAGNGITIDDRVVSVDADDTLGWRDVEVTYNYTINLSDYVSNDRTIVDDRLQTIFMNENVTSVKLTITNASRLWSNGWGIGEKAYILLSDDNGSSVLKAPVELSLTYFPERGEVELNDQTVVIPCPATSGQWAWSGFPGTPETLRMAIGIGTSESTGRQLWGSSAGYTYYGDVDTVLSFTYADSSAPKKLSVAIPVPAYDSATDAGKFLQVQNDGTLAWVSLS